MYVCICNAVTDTDIEDAVDAGADCVDAVTDATRAGSCCGTCHDAIDEILAERCGPCPLAALSPAAVAVA